MGTESLRQKGYRVVERGGAGPDGGVDLELYLGKDKYLVQCKHWRTYQVGVAIIGELYGVMAAEGAVGGFVVASGAFTADAEAFAEGRSIKLVDARTLKKLVGSPSPAPAQASAAPTTPACPVCGSEMVKRPVRRGANADGSGGMTLHQLAAEYGVSAERVRQIEVAAMKKMRKSLTEFA